MKNSNPFSTGLPLSGWLAPALVVAAAALLYVLPALRPHSHLVVLAAGAAVAALQFFGRHAIAERLGGNIADVEQIAADLAAGRLQAGGPTAASGLGASLATARRALSDIVDGVSTEASGIANGIARLAAQTTEMSLTLQLQANINREVQASIHEIDRNIQLVSGLASETEADSRKVDEMSVSGERLVTGASQRMEHIVASVQESSARISSLVGSTQQIGSIANIIKEIADQTNLLALNAAIEAARAGEQGRGFAVVADEVRKLAERTSDATSEISKMIAGIQSDTRAAVEQMQHVAPELEGGVTEARDAARMLGAIREQAHGTLAKITQLAEATAKESTQAKEIVASVAHMVETAEKTDAIIRETAETSAALESHASGLARRLSFFGHPGAAADRAQRTTIAPVMSWSTALATGHGEIDAQHRKLIDIANELNEAIQRGAGRGAIGAALEELVRYTSFHFEFEEKLMAATNNPQATQHRSEHRKLVADVLAHKSRFQRGDTLSSELLSFVRDWLVNHIVKTDKVFARHLAAAAAT